MNKLTCVVAMVLAAVIAMALAVLAFAPRTLAQPASTGFAGVCCLDTLVCIIVTEAECALQGGIYGGDNTVCGGPPLHPFGDCSCGPGRGDCTDPAGNGTPGCELLQCCGIVCLVDHFCCFNEWDAACAASASGFQPCNPTCPWDCQAPPVSGAVDVPDLLALLAAWGGPETPGTTCDLDGTGAIAVPDLLELLANWGACP